ncbi:Nif11 domain/cupin domain-containing protein [Prochlorococcus sp. MIT 1300]|uniref:Nif11 domain/cupin domain-containing protein n=1 Tax=Prochlorococcus sp. MIT 1300 TaxID=3096218 RepID=UPI002A750967|nr:Nif11 domain/cupin domain-containing protein [Prochlorococcus sp. MIT 1300]
MSEKDLQRFLHKVEQLKQMTNSLDEVDGRRELLASCVNHNQVIELARSWGYEIGRRWGEKDLIPQELSIEGLIKSCRRQKGDESKHIIHQGDTWRLELVQSFAASSPQGFWYDQLEHEWILLLRGSATIKFKDPELLLELNVGDQLHLPPHRLHRVERTDPLPGTLWLTLFWEAKN